MTLEHWAALIEASGAKKDDKGYLAPPEGKLLTLYVSSGSSTLSVQRIEAVRHEQSAGARAHQKGRAVRARFGRHFRRRGRRNARFLVAQGRLRLSLGSGIARFYYRDASASATGSRGDREGLGGINRSVDASVSARPPALSPRAIDFLFGPRTENALPARPPRLPASL